MQVAISARSALDALQIAFCLGLGWGAAQWAIALLRQLLGR